MKANCSIRQIFIFIFPIVLLFISCKKDNDNPENQFPDFKDYQFEEPEVTGSSFYIDPLNGSPAGDGSSANPWRTLQEVLDSSLIEYYQRSESYEPESELVIVNDGAPVKGGDRLVLLSGYHGYITLSRFIFLDWLTIEAENGNTPVLSHFKLNGAFEKIYLKGLTILKESYEGDGDYWDAEAINYNTGACIYLGSSNFWGKGKYVKLYGLTVKTAENTSGWSAGDWVEKSASGISLRSVEYVEIVNCRIENIRHGIAIEYASDNTSAVNNTIKNYSADGCRLISNNVFFAYNTITDCYDVDENHDDGIQSYSRGEDNSPGTGVLKNVIIRGNLIIGTTDFSNPLKGNPQGIGCFDGFFDNWIVENNVIITDHYHGISFYGMRNSKIVNNTVIDQIPDNDTSPWIMITDHKNGTPSNNCVVANNIVSSSVSTSGNNVTEISNYIFGKENYEDVYQFFVDPDANDMHLLVNETTQEYIIDKGEYHPELISSEIDKDNNQRDMIPDLGAYELQ